MEAITDRMAALGEQPTRNGSAYPDPKLREPVQHESSTEQEPAPIMLNLGSGDCALPGWTNLDIRSGTDCRRLPYADGTVAQIRASHVLEHLVMDDVLPTLRHWRDKLVPGGSVSISVPDMEKLGVMLAQRNYQPQMFNHIFGGQVSSDDFHHSGFTRDTLSKFLEVSGFGAVRPWYPNEGDTAQHPVSLNLRATRTPFELSDVRIGMTMPRLGFTDTFISVQRATKALGLDMTVSTGVYWHHGMTRLIEAAIKDGIPYLLTVDYDSLFTPSDVMLLVDTMEQFNLDAACAMQVGREVQNLLMTTKEMDGSKPLGEVRFPLEDFYRPIFPLRTGHFGLTLLRVAAFEGVKKPWFAEQPSSDGSYGEDRIDSDVNFWLKWRDAGRSLAMVCDCVIGHAQLMASFPNREIQTGHCYIGDWKKSGKPQWAR